MRPLFLPARGGLLRPCRRGQGLFPPEARIERADASPFIEAVSNGSSTLERSVNTVVFTPDWKSNNTACGSGSAGPGRVLLRPAAEDGAPDAGSLFEAKFRAWA